MGLPIGVIVDCLAVAAGGAAGTLAGGRIPEDVKKALNMMFGLCSIGLGITSVILVENMPAVILSLLIGTTLGVMLRLPERIDAAGQAAQRLVVRIFGEKMQPRGIGAQEFTDRLSTIVVLFCVSGTGIYGSMVSGMNGDHSILVSKSILDLFTALIFACALGLVVSLIAVPQFIILLAIFLLARLIVPLTTPATVGDFKACGGLIMLASGFRILDLKRFPTAAMIPCMAIVMPVSALWTAYIAPLMH